jgi:hypothetical protein
MLWSVNHTQFPIDSHPSPIYLVPNQHAWPMLNGAPSQRLMTSSLNSAPNQPGLPLLHPILPGTFQFQFTSSDHRGWMPNQYTWPILPIAPLSLSGHHRWKNHNEVGLNGFSYQFY